MIILLFSNHDFCIKIISVFLLNAYFKHDIIIFVDFVTLYCKIQIFDFSIIIRVCDFYAI